MIQRSTQYFTKHYKILNIFENKTKDFVLLKTKIKPQDLFLLIDHYETYYSDFKKNAIIKRHQLKFGRLIFVPQLMALN